MINIGNKIYYSIFLLIILFFSCQKFDISLSDWQDKIFLLDPQLSNILLVRKDHIYFSLNLKSNDNYALYYKDFLIKSYKKNVSYWVETYYNNTKQLLDSGYSINKDIYGFYFKQHKTFDSIFFCYQLSGEKVKKIKFFLLQTEEWVIK